jgi:hypothetical protein
MKEYRIRRIPPLHDSALEQRESPSVVTAVKRDMGRAFGHDFSSVRVHAASARPAAMGTQAITEGDDVYFAPRAFHAQSYAGRAMIGHELTHVVQQRQGRVSAGAGRVSVDPSLEREAHEAGLRAARGDAVSLHAAGRRGIAGRPIAQRFTEFPGPPARPYDLVSDDGKMAVLDHGKVGWAESANIASSNSVLASLKSKAKIEELSGEDVNMKPPSNPAAAEITLKKFKMTDRVAGTELDLTDDCGGANQQLMGSETYGSRSFVARNLRGTTEEFTRASTYRADDLAPGGNISTTEQLSGQIYVRIFAREFGRLLSRTAALKEWAKLKADKPDEVKRLSKQYGINEFAVPSVGQGITIGTERDMPPYPTSGYNFHFALNLMASGPDYVTLEDYHNSGVPYYLDMYGPESKSQSFAQAKSNVDAMGAATTTMVVQHAESLNGKINTATSMVDAPETLANPRKLDKDTKVSILRKGRTWMKVEVKSGPLAGESGWILNLEFSPS